MKNKNKIMTKLQNILTRFKYDSGLQILDQNFSNEIIFDRKLQSTTLSNANFSNCDFENLDFTGSYFMACDFKNCTFANTIFHKCEFWDCTFQNCQITICDLTKIDIYTNVFRNCQFNKIDLSWSYLDNCEFPETQLFDINFTGTVIDTLKTKNTTFLNLKFCESFPVKFWKSGKLTKVKDFSRFAKLLEALDEELESTDET